MKAAGNKTPVWMPAAQKAHELDSGPRAHVTETDDVFSLTENLSLALSAIHGRQHKFLMLDLTSEPWYKNPTTAGPAGAFSFPGRPDASDPGRPSKSFLIGSKDLRRAHAARTMGRGRKMRFNHVDGKRTIARGIGPI